MSDSSPATVPGRGGGALAAVHGDSLQRGGTIWTLSRSKWTLSRWAAGMLPGMSARASYHHGDLRRTLIDASLALVEEEGIGALSLREVARKAGVTHNAPYHHFPDRGALLAAIAEEGFGRLAQETAAARAAVPDDPLARLTACGQAYVRFAIASPAHFRVMFRPELA